MTDAERAVHEAAAEIPADVRERLDTAEHLSDEDRDTVIEVARKSLEGFQPKPEPETEPEPEVKPDIPTEAKPEPEPEEES
jgi:F-type H+-transporting ATPase subunit alpha